MERQDGRCDQNHRTQRQAGLTRFRHCACKERDREGHDFSRAVNGQEECGLQPLRFARVGRTFLFPARHLRGGSEVERHLLGFSLIRSPPLGFLRLGQVLSVEKRALSDTVQVRS